MTEDSNHRIVNDITTQVKDRGAGAISNCPEEANAGEGQRKELSPKQTIFRGS